MNGNPCERCGSYQDPHSCPPRWVVSISGCTVANIHANSASEAAELAAEHLKLEPARRKVEVLDQNGGRWSGNCESKVAVVHTAVVLREHPRG